MAGSDDPQRRYSDQVLPDLREAISAEVEDIVDEKTRVYRYKQNLLYTIIVGLLIAAVVWVDNETEKRVGQFCTLFINDHEGDKQRLRREITRLRTTKEYLRDAPKPLKGIDLAVERNLPNVAADVADARNEVKHDIPPPICEYQGDEGPLVTPREDPTPRVK